MKKLASILCLGLILLGGLFVVTPKVAYADAFNAGCEGLTDEQKKLANCEDDDDAEKKKNEFGNVIQQIVSIIIGISGSIALVFVIIGGVNYMTANGDTTKIKNAKDTIMYALIGLVVCALAFAIVNWVISIS